MFTYQGLREYVVTPGYGRVPAARAEGHWFSDYHSNRHLYVRHLGGNRYHVKMSVNGVTTTDAEMTKPGLQSWAINHLQFQVTENHFKVINK